MNAIQDRTDFWRCTACSTPNPTANYISNCIVCGATRPLSGPGVAAQACQKGRATRFFVSRWQRFSHTVQAASWSYLIATAFLLVVIEFLGDRCWFTTILLFGPRWVWTLPLLVLAFGAVALRTRGSGLPLALSALLIGPLLGWCFPWRSSVSGGPSAGKRFKVMTCNVNGSRVDFAALGELLRTNRLDILLLQEYDQTRDISAILPSPEWQVRVDYGLAIATRFPIKSHELLVMTDLGTDGRAGRYVLSTPEGPLSVFNVHLQTPRKGFEALFGDKLAGVPAMRENLRRRWKESELVSRWVGLEPGPVLIAGDFNTPTESAIFQDNWSCFDDAFSRAGRGLGYTKYTTCFGVRIDHILTGDGLRCTRSWVERDVGSDHRPLVSELILQEPSD